MVGEELDLLVVAARAGGSWAFARLWTQLSPGVAAYLRARGARDADDLTSEVFLAAFQRLGRFDGNGAAFRSWLFTIAHHKSVDTMRRGAGRHEVLAPDVDDGRRARSAEDEAIDGIGDGEVARLLALLTDDQRHVLLLRVVGQLSLEETAHVVGKPLGAVKQLQRRGLARLRREIEAPAVTPARSPAIAWLR